MKLLKANWMWVLGGIICVVVVYVAFVSILDSRLHYATNELDVAISAQRGVVTEASMAVRNNASNDLIDRVVKDCAVSERARFDVLLNKLSLPMTKDELSEINRLFNDCAYFYADRRQLMAINLSREVETLGEYLRLHDALYASDLADDQYLASLKTLSENEIVIAALFRRLVQLQGKIIAELVSGKSAQSVEIQQILNEVGETNKTISSQNVRNETIRRELRDYEENKM